MLGHGEVARVIATVRILDLDDVGAHVGHHQMSSKARPETRDRSRTRTPASGRASVTVAPPAFRRQFDSARANNRQLAILVAGFLFEIDEMTATPVRTFALTLAVSCEQVASWIVTADLAGRAA